MSFKKNHQVSKRVKLYARKEPDGPIVKKYDSIREAMNDLYLVQWRLYHAFRTGEPYEGYYWQRGEE